MRALIIEDKDVKALLSSLELAKYRNARPLQKGDASMEDMHLHFHLYVSRWLTDIGWDGRR